MNGRATAFLLALVAFPSALRGQTEQLEQAIRNGTREPQVLALAPEQQRAVGWVALADNPRLPFCTGTLITPSVVASAAHCLRDKMGLPLAFGVGPDPENPIGVVAVRSLHTHETEDALLLVLEGSAPRQIPGLLPIPHNKEDLDSEWGRALFGQLADSAGYGQTFDPARTGRWWAALLMSSFDDRYVVVDGQGQQGLCFGDSGGPIIVLDASGRAVTLGVEHAGDETCLDLDQLTRLDRIDDWIQEVITTAAPPEPCGEVNYFGRCAGSIVEWCDEGTLSRADCRRTDEICDFIDDTTGYYCRPKSAAEGGGEKIVLKSHASCGSTPPGAPLGAPGWLLLIWVAGRRAFAWRRRGA